MSFDPNQFLDMQIDGDNSTEFVPVPEGEYTAVATEAKPRQWTSGDGSSSGISLDIKWELDSPEVKALLDRKQVIVQQGLFLDLTDAGQLDMGKGKNVALGRLREAIGKNVKGQAFAFSQIPGCMAKVKVKHRTDNNGVIRAEVKEVAKA